MTRIDEQELLDRMAGELRTHEAPLTIVLRPLTALRLAGLLQLALRHPDIDSGNAEQARIFIEHVRGFFSDAPAVLEVLRRGDPPEAPS